MMNRRENLLRFVNHEPHDHIPCMFDFCIAGNDRESFEVGPQGGGIDGYGCSWECSDSAMGQGVPTAGWVVLDDVTKWRDQVKFPDPEDFDWQALADEQLANYNPEGQVIYYGCQNGPFLRLMHLMSFDKGLLALALEPEACDELMGAIVDSRIKTLDYIKKYFNPDIVTLFDDIASTANLFMSPDTYARIVAPHHKKWFAAVREHGMIPSIHICGHCESMVPMLPELGAQMWEICEPTNDLNALAKQTEGKLAMFGGYAMNGIYAYTEPTEEELRQSARDTIDLYAPNPSYGFMGMIMYADMQRTGGALMTLNDEAIKYGTDYYVNGRDKEAANGPLAGLHDIWHR